MRSTTALHLGLVGVALLAALPAFADAALDGARARWQAAALTTYIPAPADNPIAATSQRPAAVVRP